MENKKCPFGSLGDLLMVREKRTTLVIRDSIIPINFSLFSVRKESGQLFAEDQKSRGV